MAPKYPVGAWLHTDRDAGRHKNIGVDTEIGVGHNRWRGEAYPPRANIGGLLKNWGTWSRRMPA